MSPIRMAMMGAMQTVAVTAAPQKVLPLAVVPQKVEETATVYAVFAVE